MYFSKKVSRRAESGAIIVFFILISAWQHNSRWRKTSLKQVHWPNFLYLICGCWLGDASGSGAAIRLSITPTRYRIIQPVETSILQKHTRQTETAELTLSSVSIKKIFLQEYLQNPLPVSRIREQTKNNICRRDLELGRATTSFLKSL